MLLTLNPESFLLDYRCDSESIACEWIDYDQQWTDVLSDLAHARNLEIRIRALRSSTSLQMSMLFREVLTHFGLQSSIEFLGKRSGSMGRNDILRMLLETTWLMGPAHLVNCGHGISDKVIASDFAPAHPNMFRRVIRVSEKPHTVLIDAGSKCVRVRAPHRSQQRFKILGSQLADLVGTM